MMQMYKPIMNAAITGIIHAKADHLNAPIRPDEVADNCHSLGTGD
jgi:uncharacterized protein (DUF849 family)